jgi:RNA polymerase sigma factor (sigma-70 family)
MPRVTPKSDVTEVANCDGFLDWADSKWAGLIRFGYLVSGDQEVAEDLAQQALAGVQDRWRRLSNGGNPDTYARAIVVSQLRSRQRRRSWTGGRAAVADVPPVVPSPGDASVSADWMALWSVILGLPELMRAAVVLRFYEDRDDDAIGQVLGCAPATARVYVRRALVRLRSHPSVRKAVAE